VPFIITDAMPRKSYGETRFGERLQAIRRARGLTQVQLAKVAGPRSEPFPTTKPRLDFRPLPP